jgi:hypothetical protein
LGLYFYSKDKTYYNNSSATGNTALNIYNGGLFCEKDNVIYFSNDYDNGSLYCMSSLLDNIHKISNEQAAYINADKNYLYYIHAVDITQKLSDTYSIFHNTGVYRINQNGTKLKVINEKPSAYLTLKSNYLYFDNYDADTGFNLYRYRIDGTMDRLLEKKFVIPTAVTDKNFFFVDPESDYRISVTNLESFTSHSQNSGSFAYPVYMGDYIYYIDLSNHNWVCRMNKDGSNPTVLVKSPCSTYNITSSGKYLYYQVNDSKKKYLGRINLETLKKEVVKKGNYKQIHVTKYFVFFKDYKNKNIYVVTADDKGTPAVFDTTPAPTVSVSPSITPSSAPTTAPSTAPTATAAP